MNFIQIKEICLYVRNLDKTERFYAGKLGLKVISRVEDRHVFFRVGESVLLCFNPRVTKLEAKLPPHFAEGKQHFAFEVAAEEYEKTRSDFEKRGVEIICDYEWRPGVKSFYFEDPDGHVGEVVPTGMWD